MRYAHRRTANGDCENGHGHATGFGPAQFFRQGQISWRSQIWCFVGYRSRQISSDGGVRISAKTSGQMPSLGNPVRKPA